MKIRAIILIIALAGIVTACSTKPPTPKKPDESKRVPVNKIIPIELGGHP